jgi:hypothetical protein
VKRGPKLVSFKFAALFAYCTCLYLRDTSIYTYSMRNVLQSFAAMIRQAAGLVLTGSSIGKVCKMHCTALLSTEASGT